MVIVKKRVFWKNSVRSDSANFKAIAGLLTDLSQFIVI